MVAVVEEDQEKAGLTWVVDGLDAACGDFPKTRRSKSSSFVDEMFMLDPPIPFAVLEEMSRERGSTDWLVADSSWSFLVCSRSILDDRDLMRSMNDLNCCRSRSGPRLKIQSMGNTSRAKKSVSAILPT